MRKDADFPSGMFVFNTFVEQLEASCTDELQRCAKTVLRFSGSGKHPSLRAVFSKKLELQACVCDLEMTMKSSKHLCSIV